jgi:hypothetical protein
MRQGFSSRQVGRIAIPGAILAGLAACTVAPPAGPSVLVLPGKAKDFAAFQQDDFACRQYASGTVGGQTPAAAANASVAGSAAVGTLIGAGAGAALGAAAGNPALGAAAGAGAGLLGGTAVGAGNAGLSAGAAQQRYDIGYVQCMSARGNQTPTEVPALAAYEPASPVLYGDTYYGGYGGWYAPALYGGGWGWGWGPGFGWWGPGLGWYGGWGGGWGYRGWGYRGGYGYRGGIGWHGGGWGGRGPGGGFGRHR